MNYKTVIKYKFSEDGGSGESVTVIIPIKNKEDFYVVTKGRSYAVIKWCISDPDHHTVKPSILHTVDVNFPKNFFNDGKCDSQGRFWAGIFYLLSKIQGTKTRK